MKVAELRFGSTVEWEAERAPESDSHDEDLGPNDQKRVVTTLIRAADVAGIPAPRRPWLDDLPNVVDLRDLPAQGDGQILLGLADLPEKQQQNATYFLPDRDGSMLVFGTSGSGKTTVLKTIATAAGMRPDLGRCEVYGLDFASGALGAIDRLPHVGSVIDGDDAERVQRLLRTLGRELDRRSELFAKASAANLTEYRELVDPQMARIVLLIDNYPEFKSEWEISSARAPFYQVFMRILGEGRPLGVHAVITADRGGAVPTAVAANISRRVVLRLADPNQYTLLGAPKDVLDDTSVPGRAVRRQERGADGRAGRHGQRRGAEQGARGAGGRAPRPGRAGRGRDRCPAPAGRGVDDAEGRRRSAGHRHRGGHVGTARVRPGRAVRRHRPAAVGQDQHVARA